MRRCEKISHVRRSFICRSIYTSFFLKNPSLRRSREKTFSVMRSYVALNVVAHQQPIFAPIGLVQGLESRDFLDEPTNEDFRHQDFLTSAQLADLP